MRETYYERNRDTFLSKQRARRQSPEYRIKRNAQDRARRRKNKTKSRAQYKRDAARISPERKRYYKLRSILKGSFTLSFDDYKAWLNKHKNLCFICNRPDQTGIALAVDHNHSNGKLRGLLCGHCNTGLGLFKDNPNLLQKAIDYLHQYS
jgi:hypothetical protein